MEYFLILFLQSKPLNEIVEEVCTDYSINTTVATEYALQYAEGEKYITEENRKDLTNGDMLKLTESPVRSVILLYFFSLFTHSQGEYSIT